MWNRNAIRWAAPLTLVASLAVSPAHAQQATANAVFKEVMTECKHTKTSDAMFFVIVPSAISRAPTNQEIDDYVASEKMFKETTASSSPCWTRKRWQKYVRATLVERQKTYNSTNTGR